MADKIKFIGKFSFVVFKSAIVKLKIVRSNFMKNMLYILILTTLSCNNQTKQTDKTINSDTTKQITTNQKSDNSKYYTTKDTLLITTETGDTLKYTKDEFNKIVDNQSELLNDIPLDPDLAYYCNAGSGDFGSEVGQDDYYVLYAYFLKQKNGIEKNAELRKKLIDIYSNINSLFQHFQYGGTFFGHQQQRVLGYAEYSVYVYLQIKDDIEKTYDIKKQKNLYISSIRQLIEDEIKIDSNTLGKEKIKRSKELNAIVDNLDKLITDNFYLKRAQEFHYEHYDYY
jgi:hypothetical protein